MSVSVPLNENGSVVLDGNGNGQVAIGPLSAREVWNPSMVHVSANQDAVSEAQCQIFIGDVPIAPNFRDGTFSGSAGDSSDSVGGSVVKCGHKIIAVWSGGDAGVVATLAVTGTKEI